MPKAISACFALILTGLCSASHADIRSEWGAPVKLGPPLDDNALMAVTGQGALDDNAVKILQTTGKLGNLVSSLGLRPTALTAALLESSEKQMIQAQQKMAMGITQTMGQTVQISSTIIVMAAPISAPVAGLPMLGIPMLPPKANNDKDK
ncbi:hypothetical protein [Aquabacterium sp.]|uniref:hypothetical protein n=1 Tax=Aquabacterium sp. TaxID=1872578 RepID=UPI002E301B71|nr:hypothetical protein [Aquabacterium sp.]HEX5310317.1 hypothetical protein [Aquabacterium sp.]